MIKEIFVNLSVKDLKVAQDFFSRLGFGFNPDFTDDRAACLVLGENIYAMLLVEEFFKGFSKKDIPDTLKTAEVINALAVESREKVDQIAEAALAAGGKFSSDPADHGWMYSRSFQDPDGHIWEVLYTDMAAFPKG